MLPGFTTLRDHVTLQIHLSMLEYMLSWPNQSGEDQSYEHPMRNCTEVFSQWKMYFHSLNWHRREFDLPTGSAAGSALLLLMRLVAFSL